MIVRELLDMTAEAALFEQTVKIAATPGDQIEKVDTIIGQVCI